MYTYVHICIYIFYFYVNLKSQSPFFSKIPENRYDILPYCDCHIKGKHVGKGLEGGKMGTI